jgi:anti-sigma regulatory factor (Ser/Thr protein kinase)
MAMVAVHRTVLSATYAAVPESVAVARRAIVDFAADAGVSKGQLHDVWLAASEALTNVVKHAYEEQAGSIHLTAALAGGELCLLIADDGCGFRAHHHRGGLGLGLVLIASVCDELAIVKRSRGGTELALRFKLDARNRARAGQDRGSVASAAAPATSRFSTTT